MSPSDWRRLHAVLRGAAVHGRAFATPERHDLRVRSAAAAGPCTVPVASVRRGPPRRCVERARSPFHARVTAPLVPREYPASKPARALGHSLVAERAQSYDRLIGHNIRVRRRNARRTTPPATPNRLAACHQQRTYSAVGTSSHRRAGGPAGGHVDSVACSADRACARTRHAGPTVQILADLNHKKRDYKFGIGAPTLLAQH